MSSKSFQYVVDLQNPFLTFINGVDQIAPFIQIFNQKTILDIIGEALELHFNNDLNEFNLSDAMESILLQFSNEQIKVYIQQYVPYTSLLVLDGNNNTILNFNISQFIDKLYWQIQSLIANHLIGPMQLKDGETVVIENVHTDNNELKFIIKVMQPNIENRYHGSPTVHAGFF